MHQHLLLGINKTAILLLMIFIVSADPRNAVQTMDY
jgi:hypothetical protein